MTPFSAAVLGIGWAGLIAFLIYRAIRQYGKYQVLSALPAVSKPPHVRIIVPARNEETGIEQCIRSLLAQDHLADRLRLTVVDDGSTDATPEILRSLAAGDSRLRVLIGQALPAGWVGKPHACWQAAINQPDESEDWLCFIDADTVSEPALISSAVALADKRGYDMLSLEPFQMLVTPGERLILPAGFFILAFTQDLGRVNDPASPDAKANGQFILIRRAVYDAVGGHAAVRAEVSEDGALARLVKGRGYKLGLIGAESLIRTRMFRNLSAVWNGLGRSACDTIGGPGLTIFFSCAGMLLAGLAIVVPVLVTLTIMQASANAWSIVACTAGWAGTLSLLGVHIGAARHFRIPVIFGFMFPFGYILAAMVGFNSAIRHLRGQVTWKGRVYAPPETSS